MTHAERAAKITKVRRLRDGAATPGERLAAIAALSRLEASLPDPEPPPLVFTSVNADFVSAGTTTKIVVVVYEEFELGGPWSGPWSDNGSKR